MNGPAVLHRTLPAALSGGFVVSELSLHYRASDPVAMRMSLRLAGGWASWHVARDLVHHSLMVDTAENGPEVSRVIVRPLASVPPALPRALIVLRNTRGRFLLTVDAVELAAFVSATYEACSIAEEQQRVDHEAETWLEFFSSSQQSGNGNSNE